MTPARRHTVIRRGRAMVLLVACLPAAHVSPAASALEVDSRLPIGSYALHLEARPSGMPTCIAIAISRLGLPPTNGVRLVARSTDESTSLLPGYSRVAYETIKEVPVAAVRSGHTLLCSSDVQRFLRMSADGLPGVMEVAVFPVGGPAPSGRDWDRPEYERARLSYWTALLMPGWHPQSGLSARSIGPR